MARFDGKTHKRKWTKLEINKISNVSSPAQAPALAAIIKSAADNPGEAGKPQNPFHKEDYMGMLFEAATLKEKLEAVAKGVFGDDYVFENIEDFVKGLGKELDSAIGLDDVGFALVKEMSEDDMKKQMEGMDKQMRSMYMSMPMSERKKMMGMSKAGRMSYMMDIMARNKNSIRGLEKEANETIESADGTTVKKSDNPQLFDFIKSTNERLEKQEHDLRVSRLEKSAAETYPLIKGQDSVKAEAMAHIEDMADPTLKEFFEDMMKSHQDVLSKSGLFKEMGTNGVPDGEPEDIGKSELASMIKSKYDNNK